MSAPRLPRAELEHASANASNRLEYSRLYDVATRNDGASEPTGSASGLCQVGH
jgi:hypothetical protein